MASLYELSGFYTALLDAYDGAETQEERDALIADIATAEGKIEDKAEAYAKIIRMKEEEAKAFKAEADRLTAKKQAAENMAKRLKDAMLGAMVLTGADEIKTSIGKWKLQMNPVSCQVLDAGAVPAEYHIPQEDKIDKAALIKAHKETGEVFDGVEFKQEQGIRFR